MPKKMTPAAKILATEYLLPYGLLIPTPSDPSDKEPYNQLAANGRTWLVERMNPKKKIYKDRTWNGYLGQARTELKRRQPAIAWAHHLHDPATQARINDASGTTGTARVAVGLLHWDMGDIEAWVRLTLQNATADPPVDDMVVALMIASCVRFCEIIRPNTYEFKFADSEEGEEMLWISGRGKQKVKVPDLILLWPGVSPAQFIRVLKLVRHRFVPDGDITTQNEDTIRVKIKKQVLDKLLVFEAIRSAYKDHVKFKVMLDEDGAVEMEKDLTLHRCRDMGLAISFYHAECAGEKRLILQHGSERLGHKSINSSQTYASIKDKRVVLVDGDDKDDDDDDGDDDDDDDDGYESEIIAPLSQVETQDEFAVAVQPVNKVRGIDTQEEIVVEPVLAAVPTPVAASKKRKVMQTVCTNSATVELEMRQVLDSELPHSLKMKLIQKLG